VGSDYLKEMDDKLRALNLANIDSIAPAAVTAAYLACNTMVAKDKGCPAGWLQINEAADGHGTVPNDVAHGAEDVGTCSMLKMLITSKGSLQR